MSNDWIEWKGGECPVAADAVVDYMLRDGEVGKGIEAYRLRWDDRGMGGDLIAYRLHVPQQPANTRQVAGTHYKYMGVEPWDVVDTWPMEQRIGAYRHGALKYLMRMGSKDESAQEIAKGIHYMEKLLEVLKASQ